MSIDFLFELERAVDAGKDIFACPGLAKNQWVIGRSADELRKAAQRAADSQKMSVNIVRLIARSEAITGDLFLVPTEINEPGARGEPQVRWKVVETREAAEMFKDVRRGPPPYFGIQTLEAVSPRVSGGPL